VLDDNKKHYKYVTDCIYNQCLFRTLYRTKISYFYTAAVIFVNDMNTISDTPSQDNSQHIDDFLPQPAVVFVDHDGWASFWKIHAHTYAVNWKCDFLIFGETTLLPRPLEVSGQIATGPEYWCDCKLRGRDPIRYFCYTLSGTGGFKDQTGSYLVPAGHAFLVEGDNPQASYFYPPDATEPWRFLAFTFHGLQAHVMVRALLREYGPIYQLPIESSIITKLLRYESRNYGHANFEVVQIKLYEAVELVTDLLMTLMASKQSHEGTNQAEDLVQQAVSMITADTPQYLRVNDVAKRLGVSREHLSRIFQTRLGKSLRTFMLEQKMRRACLLLKETDMPIKTIATQLGYTAYPNFSHAFEQLIHMTPREFRLTGTMNHVTFTPQPTKEN